MSGQASAVLLDFAHDTGGILARPAVKKSEFTWYWNCASLYPIIL